MEELLATPTTRIRWAASHFLFAIAAVAVVIVLGGTGVGLGYGISVGDPLGQAARMAIASAGHIPAAWVMASIVLLLFGWVPRAALAASWGLLVAFIVLGEFGALWQLPSWLLDVSPFAHSPRLPGGAVEWPSLVGLVVVAALVAVAGFTGWRRRDLTA